MQIDRNETNHERGFASEECGVAMLQAGQFSIACLHTLWLQPY